MGEVRVMGCGATDVRRAVPVPVPVLGGLGWEAVLVRFSGQG
ncbi:hypothetical protein [Streptomyces sp. NBC_00878]|nr:hypothetical protein [Streptomyces sp. NBC_00878]MCX4906536.1 hypothetical protein [Streptomyces sp. NBC_00878]